MRLTVHAFLAALALSAALGLAAASRPAAAGDAVFGPFSVDRAHGEAIRLAGNIGAGAALDFRRALAAAPNAKLLVLDSEGGIVDAALLIADDVHQRGLATFIPESAVCYSACAYIFLAGSERSVLGRLGVHQISADEPDMEGVQVAISDVIDMLTRFGTPAEVLTIMFRTPPDEMHVFTSEEVAELGIDRTASVARQAVAAAPTPLVRIVPPPAPVLAEAPPQPDRADVTPPPPALQPAPPPGASTAYSGPGLDDLSVIQRYATRPDRLAVFVGLDLYGGDLTAVRAGDLADCARQCLVAGDFCKGLTYNTDPSVRGANCFLKGGSWTFDGNSAALSAIVLGAAEADPAPVRVGTIDPAAGMLADIDFPHGDLSRAPYAGARTGQQCRLACVEDQRCGAFTFVTRLRQCWLKSTAYAGQFRPGMVSGRKQWRSFSPTKIISLD